MINKILVAIDNSDTHQTVFNHAVALAKATKASMILLHILSTEDLDYPILPTYVYYSVLKDSDGDVFRQKYTEYETRNLDFLQDLTQQAIVQGVNTEFTQSSGNPGWEICQLASNCSADLIVVGSRGLKGLKEMFLGSVSNYVMHHAPCSVLIVRQPIDSESDQSSTDEIDKSELLTSNS
ncbi:MAG: universal stress protein [Cyanobacteria bacterium P01_G01_bin.19]